MTTDIVERLNTYCERTSDADMTAPDPNEAEQMRDLLSELEWADPCDDCTVYSDAFCPCCGSWRTDGHFRDCRLAAFIKVEGQL